MAVVSMTEASVRKTIESELFKATTKVAMDARSRGRKHQPLNGTLESVSVATATDHIERVVDADREAKLLEISSLIQREAKRLWPDPNVYPSKRIRHIVEGLDIANSIVMAEPRPSTRIPPELLVPQWWVMLAFGSAIAFAMGTIVWNVLH